MIKNSLCCLFCVLSITSYSQNYRATYQIDFVPNIEEASIKIEFGVLLLGENKSIYATENYLKKDSIYSLVNEGKITNREGMFEMREKRLKTDFEHLVQKDYEKETMKISEGILIDNYVYQQSTKPLWQLSNETQKINSYKCQKATTYFQGRTYEAWYSTEIPISDGPYKFWGLPGLIISIQDSNNEFNFKLVTFKEYDGFFPTNLNDGRKNIETSFPEFKEVRMKSNTNRAEMMKSMGMDVSKVMINGKPPTKEHLQKMNRKINYIEKYQ
jgi:GLPGLI family protein